MTETTEDAIPGEQPNIDEKILIERFKEKKALKEMYDQKLKEVTVEFESIEAQLISLLEDDGKSASARYEGLGHVVIVEGNTYASIEKGRQEDVINSLISLGREDMIKTTVHSATLSSFVKEQLKQNLPLPEGITFYRPKGLRFYQEKNV